MSSNRIVAEDQCYFEESAGQLNNASEENSQEKIKPDRRKPIKKLSSPIRNKKAIKPSLEPAEILWSQFQQENSDPNESKGRPKGDNIEANYLKISRTFNDIFYHFGKLLIFLHLIKGDAGTHSLTLQNYESKWMKEATDFMSQDNFPASIEERNEGFLLHPNTLHALFQCNKKNKISTYNSEQIKYYFFAFLIRRGLLTTSNFTYITQYWNDIIRLLGEWRSSQARRNRVGGAKPLYVECEVKLDDSRKGMVGQLHADKSMAAYEIACYLKSCCDHFAIQITPLQKT